MLAASAKWLPQLSPVNAATALNRLARCPDGASAPRESLARLGARVLSAPPGGAGADLDARSLANTVWAFASLGFSDAPLLTAISTESLPRISQFEH